MVAITVSPPSATLITNATQQFTATVTGTSNTSFTWSSATAAEEFVPGSPNTKLLVEDSIQSTAGSISTGASLGASDPWGAVLATFRHQ